MPASANPEQAQSSNEYRGTGSYQGAAIRWRDFAETSVDSANPDYQEIVIACGFRLFIMGVEVTPHVTGSINVDRHGRDGVNSLSFTLDNNFSKFVFTNWNLGGSKELDRVYFGNSLTTTQGVPMNNTVPVLDALVSSSTTPDDMPSENKLNWLIPGYAGKDKYIYDEAPKRDLFNYKKLLGIQSSSTHNKKKARYTLTPGTCAIHLMDHVRLFVLDTSEDNVVTELTQWKPEYTGFVSSVSVNENPVTGESTISVSCYDIRQLLRRMRYVTNLADASVLSTLIVFENESQDGAGIFNDLLIVDANTDFSTTLANCTADTVIRAMLLGEDPAALRQEETTAGRAEQIEQNQDAKYPHDKLYTNVKNLEAQYKGKISIASEKSSGSGSKPSPVGTFTMGLYKTYQPPKSNKDTKTEKLEEWLDLMNFGISRQWLSYDDVTRIGRLTRPSIGVSADATGDISPFSAYNGFVHFLVPAGGLSVSSIWDKIFVTFDGSANMSNRMEVIEQMCSTIDYQIQVNTMGDILFEFPMYDFLPEAFGKYKYTMALSDSIKSQEFNDEGEGNPITGLMVTGGRHNDDESFQAEDRLKDLLYTVYIKSEFLASKYGGICESLPVPWALGVWDDEDKAENTEKLQQLASFGVIEFVKRVAKMSSMSLTGMYNPYVWPNKPIVNRNVRRAALLGSVNHSIQINGSCSTSVSCEFVRHADIDGEFINICGAKNTPFSYAHNKGLALFPHKGVDKGSHEISFTQNGATITVIDEFGIEIIEPTQAMIDSVKTKFGLQDVPSSSYPLGTQSWTDPYKVWNAFRSLPQEEQDKINAMAKRLGSIPGWRYYQYMLSESQYKTNNPNAQGSGANGLIQFMPATLMQMADRGLLDGGSPPAPKGLESDPRKPGYARSKAIMTNWFQNSSYCAGPDAKKNQIDLTESYLKMQMQAVGSPSIDSMGQLNGLVFMPAAVKNNPNMTFSDPRQPTSVQNAASKTAAQNNGADSLSAVIRMKGISEEAPSETDLEKARVLGVKSSAQVTSTGNSNAASGTSVSSSAPTLLGVARPASDATNVNVGRAASGYKTRSTSNSLMDIPDEIVGTTADRLGAGINTSLNNLVDPAAARDSVANQIPQVSASFSQAIVDQITSVSVMGQQIKVTQRPGPSVGGTGK